jgi:hypothetical protein
MEVSAVKGAKGQTPQGAVTSSWVIVEEADQELRPLSAGELELAADVFGDEAAKEMAEFSEELARSKHKAS